MKYRIILLAAFATFALAACNNVSKTESKTDGAAQTAAVYQCPMDCEKGKTYDKAGKCPVCEMDLEKK
jgi:outer membrane biogenesis lipoprotein LolB